MTDARRRTVLVVDDDPMLRAMASTALRHAGFETAEADGGASALAAHDPSSLALVLLDVMMPDVDGYEVCRTWRGRPEAADLPILMLTGLSDADSIERAYAVGATDFIVKPVHWRLLVQRVRYALRAAAAAESARRSRERLERAQRMARMGSWELALGEQRLACSPELAHALGFELPESPVADASVFLRYVHEQDRGTVEAARHKACREGVPYLINYRIRRPDGSERFVVEQASPVRDPSGRLVAVEGITQDITDRVEAQRQISRLARQDPVTGLPNRTFFQDVAAVSLERAARLRTACALLHLDVNRFKQVNDAYGRAEGDAVLRTLAERLQASIRTSDVATVGGTSSVPVLARIGGNAFTLLLLDVGGERQAEMVAERLLRAIAAPLVVHGHELVLGASLGIAMFPRDAREAEALERCAEQAVYAAKGTGRAQIRFFDEEINGRAGARLAREAELRRAIAEGQLRLHYQPKFDAARGVIVGAEALVRWQHPERGLVSPGEFIPLAEETGLIGPLTEWVLETACADQAQRLAAGIAMVSVAVNLSSAIFGDDALGTRLAALVARHGLDARWLTLEVTESLLMQDVERAVPRLQELRERGFALSLDDFGTGYSSLGYLKRFPIDELKIDRSFVVDATRGGRDAALAASIIALGREFGLVVVAEGVETPAQSRFLLQQGCVCQQGFLFARPLPAAGFDALLGRVAGATAPV